MVYGHENFPPQFQFKLKPEIHLGKHNSADFSNRLRQNQSIIDENMGTIETLHDKADTRLNKIDRMKARLKKQERDSQKKHPPIKRAHDPEFKNIGQTVQQIKGASRRHKRLRFLAKKSDEHFQLMIYLHGFKTALAHRKQDLKKLEKNLQYIDYLGDKLERFFHKMDEQEQERERRGQPARKVDASKQPTTAQKLKIKDPKLEKAKARRRRERIFPF